MNEKRKQLYEYLSNNGMTDLTYDDFSIKYGTDSNRFSSLYSYLRDNNMTDLDSDSFMSEYFGDVKKNGNQPALGGGVLASAPPFISQPTEPQGTPQQVAPQQVEPPSPLARNQDISQYLQAPPVEEAPPMVQDVIGGMQEEPQQLPELIYDEAPDARREAFRAIAEPEDAKYQRRGQKLQPYIEKKVSEKRAELQDELFNLNTIIRNYGDPATLRPIDRENLRGLLSRQKTLQLTLGEVQPQGSMMYDTKTGEMMDVSITPEGLGDDFINYLKEDIGIAHKAKEDLTEKDAAALLKRGLEFVPSDVMRNVNPMAAMELGLNVDPKALAIQEERDNLRFQQNNMMSYISDYLRSVGSVVAGTISGTERMAEQTVGRGLRAVGVPEWIAGSPGAINGYGESVQNLVSDIFPTDPDKQDRFRNELVKSLGSLTGFMLVNSISPQKSLPVTQRASVSARVMNDFRNITPALYAAGVGQGGEMYKRALEATGDPDIAAASFWRGMASGGVQVIPMIGIYNRMNSATGGRMSKYIFSRALNNSLKSGADIAAQDFFGTLLTNMSDNELYDFSRQLMTEEEIGQSLIAGLGAMFTGLRVPPAFMTADYQSLQQDRAKNEQLLYQSLLDAKQKYKDKPVGERLEPVEGEGEMQIAPPGLQTAGEDIAAEEAAQTQQPRTDETQEQQEQAVLEGVRDGRDETQAGAEGAQLRAEAEEEVAPSEGTQEQKLDYQQTDSKGRAYTYYSNTSESGGVTTTTYTFNRSDKDSSSRNKTGVPVNQALGDKYEIPSEEIPEGAEVVNVLEIREGADRSAATVTFESNGRRYQGEVLLSPTTPSEGTQAEAPLQQPTPRVVPEAEAQPGDYFTREIDGETLVYQKQDGAPHRMLSVDEANAFLEEQRAMQEQQVAPPTPAPPAPAPQEPVTVYRGTALGNRSDADGVTYVTPNRGYAAFYESGTEKPQNLALEELQQLKEPKRGEAIPITPETEAVALSNLNDDMGYNFASLDEARARLDELGEKQNLTDEEQNESLDIASELPESYGTQEQLDARYERELAEYNRRKAELEAQAQDYLSPRTLTGNSLSLGIDFSSDGPRQIFEKLKALGIATEFKGGNFLDRYHSDLVAYAKENNIDYYNGITGGVQASLNEAPQEIIVINDRALQPTQESLDRGYQEVTAVKEGRATTTAPVKIFKGKFGKRNPDGTIRSAHTGVNGAFGSSDVETAKRYEEKGVEPVEFILPVGTTMEVVEVEKAQGMSTARRAETDAINASDAQVVKLITLDGTSARPVEQYIIKDPNILNQQYAIQEREAAEVPMGEQAEGGQEVQPTQQEAEAEVEAVAEKTGVKAKNLRDLYNVNRDVFGLNRLESLTNAIVMDRMVGAMAKRAGISKEAMYGRLEFRKTTETDLPQGVKFQVDAWHGSPYLFDKFTTEAIGTGEGAQAFGWGLYFTDLEGIAKNYAKTLANKPDAVKEVLFNHLKNESRKDKVLKDLNDTKDILFDLKDYDAVNNVEAAIELVKSIDRENVYDFDFENKGNLYKVSLHQGKTPDQYTYLEWDKPISNDQRKKVADYIMSSIKMDAYITRQFVYAGIEFDWSADGRTPTKVYIPQNITGRELYNIFVRANFQSSDNPAQKASMDLLEAGIDGMKYPAESISRGATSATARGFNYVIFDENAVSIEEVIRFQKDAVESRGAMMMALDGKAIIYALSNPNVSTPLHEMAHVFEHYLTDAEKRSVLRWAGKKEWDTGVSEKFARGAEKYLAEGKAPTFSLQKIFDKFKQWLTDIYNGIKGSEIDLQLNDGMRDIYSKMLGVEVEQAAEQEAVGDADQTARNYGFTNKHHAKNAIQKYLGEDVDADAITEDQVRRASEARAAGTVEQQMEAEQVGTRNVKNTGIAVNVDLKGIWDWTAKKWRKYTKSRGLLPKNVFDKYIRMMGNESAALKQVDRLRTRLDRAVKNDFGTTYNKMSAQQKTQLDLALRGDVNAMNNLPIATREVIADMRRQVDALSQMVIDLGLVEGELEIVLQENMGTYLTRSYRKFEDPDWISNVPEQIVNRAKNFIRQENPELTQDEVDGLLTYLLQKDAGTDLNIFQKAPIGSKGKVINLLKGRKEIPFELRQLYGEYSDPFINYSKSITKIASLLARDQFLKGVREDGLNVYLFERPTGEYNVPIAGAKSKALEPLNGLFTTKDISDAFRSLDPADPVFDGGLDHGLRMYLRLNGLVKTGKTIASPQTHFRNFYGNILIMVNNGYLFDSQTYREISPTFNKVYKDLLNKGDKDFENYLLKLTRLRVTDESVNANDLKGIIKDIDIKEGGILDWIQSSQAGKIIKATQKGATKLYQAEDDFYKIIAFEVESRRLKDAYGDTKTQEWIDERAAQKVRMILPTYSLVPKFIKQLRRFPFVGTFVSFPFEIIRTYGNTINLAYQELNSPQERAIGQKRAAGIMLNTLLVPTISALSAALIGVDDEERQAARRMMAPWTENSDILWLERGDDGLPRFIDMGYSDPYNYLRKPINTIVLGIKNGEQPIPLVVEAGSEMLKPFAGEEILARHVREVLSNKKTQTGSAVYNPQDEWDNITIDILEHLSKALEPGGVSSARRIYKGFNKEAQSTGRVYDPTEEILAIPTGQRWQRIDPLYAVQFKFGDAMDAMQDAKRIYNSAKYRGDDINAAYEQSTNRQEQIYNDLKADYDAAMKLMSKTKGVDQTKNELDKILKDAGFNSTLRNQLRSGGGYLPFDIESGRQTKPEGSSRTRQTRTRELRTRSATTRDLR